MKNSGPLGTDFIYRDELIRRTSVGLFQIVLRYGVIFFHSFQPTSSLADIFAAYERSSSTRAVYATPPVLHRHYSNRRKALASL